jgi:hypothetical protein
LHDVQLAACSGFSRHQAARWLAGATERKLPEWLALIDAASFRLLDFIAALHADIKSDAALTGARCASCGVARG